MLEQEEFLKKMCILALAQLSILCLGGDDTLKEQLTYIYKAFNQRILLKITIPVKNKRLDKACAKKCVN